jgi:hypothetical protein
MLALLALLAAATAGQQQPLSCHPAGTTYSLDLVPVAAFKTEPMTQNGTNYTFSLTLGLCGANTEFSSQNFLNADFVNSDWAPSTAADGTLGLAAQLSFDGPESGGCPGTPPCQTTNLFLSCGEKMPLQFVKLTETVSAASQSVITVAAHFTTAAVCAATPAPAGTDIEVAYYEDYKCASATPTRTASLTPGCYKTADGGAQLRFWADFGAAGGAMVVQWFTDAVCATVATRTAKFFLNTCYAELDRTSFRVTAAPAAANITVSSCTDYLCKAQCRVQQLSPQCVATAGGGSELHYCVPQRLGEMVVNRFTNATDCTGAPQHVGVYSMFKCYSRSDMSSFTPLHCSV